MAVLTPRQVDAIRQAYAREIEFDTGVAHTKPILNVAIQAIEDTLSSAQVQTAIVNAIDTATSPVVIPLALKRLLIKQVIVSLGQRFS